MLRGTELQNMLQTRSRRPRCGHCRHCRILGNRKKNCSRFKNMRHLKNYLVLVRYFPRS